MQELIKLFLSKKTWALVGASQNKKKYGNIIFRYLKKNTGFTLYPVNPKIKEIEGYPCYPSLTALPVKPEVVNLVVPPSVCREVVKEGIQLGIKHFWMQPGAEDKDAIEMIKKEGLSVIHGACVMAVLKNQGR
ncbi:MAG: CoA-binding protein [Candidatus Syntrophonatronum acetioxidans]|uniref:CoA-binding protein n=1 Tax=Candidatus Syntrophonatronum acetioxidans TaxID=1795816 RepID=A0A424YE51_9FIRM|nr:MAG: CoA-binding protein [Candidatus Syntrophonatronum acetioxidans]